MLRFTGDIWKNHPCCVITMNEELTKRKPEWTQKVINAVVRGQSTPRRTRKRWQDGSPRTAKDISPVPAEIVERAMTKYDLETYGPSKAIRHPEWGNGRIDFQPWPYPTATKLIVEAMNKTVVSGDTAFLKGLDPSA